MKKQTKENVFQEYMYAYRLFINEIFKLAIKFKYMRIKNYQVEMKLCS